MKKVTQKCDYCLQEQTDEIGIGLVEIRRVYMLGTKDACRNCHEKAQRLLEISLSKSGFGVFKDKCGRCGKKLGKDNECSEHGWNTNPTNYKKEDIN